MNRQDAIGRQVQNGSYQSSGLALLAALGALAVQILRIVVHWASSCSSARVEGLALEGPQCTVCVLSVGFGAGAAGASMGGRGPPKRAATRMPSTLAPS